MGVICFKSKSDFYVVMHLQQQNLAIINEPSRGKTNNVVSEQVRHKPTCTVIEES